MKTQMCIYNHYLRSWEILWVGVMIVDVIRPKGSRHSILKPFVCGTSMISLHMAYLQGAITWPLCGLDVNTRRFSHLKRNVYQGHLHYLGRDHPYWRDCVSFNGQVEHIIAPTRVSIVDFMKREKEGEDWFSKRINT